MTGDHTDPAHADPTSTQEPETPGSPQLRVRLGLNQARLELAEYAVAGTSTRADHHLRPGDLLTETTRTKLLWGQIQAWAVAAERIVYGTSWAVVAGHHGLTERAAVARWGRFVDQILAGEPNPSWLPVVYGGAQVSAGTPPLNVPVGRNALLQLAARQDEAYRRYATGPDLGSDPPVSGNLPN